VACCTSRPELTGQNDGVDEAAARDLLAALRAETLARIEAMTADFESIVSASADANADDEHDPEGSTIAFERAQVAALREQARTQLIELDRAGLRLEDGTYGRCERCGQDIAPERLAARPATRTCVRCG
jgi:DnaK suppressor protein